MVTVAKRQASIDLLKLFAILGVLLIHLVGKKLMYGVIWYAQAVPIFMVIMGYNCKADFPTKKKLLNLYVPYALIFIASLALTLVKDVSLWINYLPIGFLPVSGPGTYWILLFFLYIFIGPLMVRLNNSLGYKTLLPIIFAISWIYEMTYSQIDTTNLGGVKFLYSSNPIRYMMCFSLGILIKQKTAQWFIKRMWPLCLLSILYLYVNNYSDIYIPSIMFTNYGWTTGENCFAAFYPAMICALFIKNKSFNGDDRILYFGKITYYVFLFQILWFVVMGFLKARLGISTAIFAPFTIVGCLIGGHILKVISQKILDKIYKW